MQSNINEYGRVSIWLTSTNISGSCSGRVAPLYLRGAGWYSSVSYDWGNGIGQGDRDVRYQIIQGGIFHAIAWLL